MEHAKKHGTPEEKKAAQERVDKAHAAHTKAHEEAENAGKGVLLLDGQLIENLHVEESHRIVGLADRIAEIAG